MVLDADVCVVGSGAGGGVIAGTLAGEGKHVVVLEMGGYYNESDFNQLELWAYENLFLGGGLMATEDGSLALMAGSNLGGGTTVNWTNCIRTRDNVREQWEREFGLEGVAGPDYDAHLDAVWRRLGVNDECSDYNGPHQRMQEACEALGYDFVRITRNTHRSTYDPGTAGFLSFGDQSGSKQGTLKTYLQDAFEHGAQVRGALPRRPHRGRGRARRRRRGAPTPTRRAPRPACSCAHPRSWPRAVRWRRRPCCCARASAAPPWATTCACTPPAASSASTTSRRRAGGARRRPRSAASSPTSRTATASWSSPPRRCPASAPRPCPGTAAASTRTGWPPARPRRRSCSSSATAAPGA